MRGDIKSHICPIVLMALFSATSLYADKVSFGYSDIVYTMTPCSRSRALSNIDLFSESQLYYYFDIYDFVYNEKSLDNILISGSKEDFQRVFSGYSYGTFKIVLFQANIIMYANKNTGKYSAIMFSNSDLGGGIASNKVRNLFERSISIVDDK